MQMKWLLGFMLMLNMSLAYAKVEVPIYLITESGPGKLVGNVTLENAFDGVLITPHLKGLPPGAHGFHIHLKPDCGEKGMAAGPHLDPAGTNKHEGPYNKEGHLGDLPLLIVAEDGTATSPVLAPRFKLEEVKGHSLMIHANGDTYENQPENGGGGARIACGVIN